MERYDKIYVNSRTVLHTSIKASEAAEVGNDKVGQLIGQIDIIREKIVGTQEITESLRNQSNEIRVILDTIANIASQTNLLALMLQLKQQELVNTEEVLPLSPMKYVSWLRVLKGQQKKYQRC